MINHYSLMINRFMLECSGSNLFMKPLHIRLSLLFGFLALFPFISNTQAATSIDISSTQDIIKPVIDSADSVEVNKNILFDGSRSIEDKSVTNIRFLWDFGDNTVDSGVEIAHTYEEPGEYNVTLSIQYAGQTQQVQKSVFVFKQAQSILITQDYEKSDLEKLISNLKQKSISARIITLSESLSQDDQSFIEKSTFIFSTAKPADLVTSKYPTLLKNKTLVIISDDNLTTLERLSKNSFASIGAEKILLTNIEALMPQEAETMSVAEATNLTELNGILTTRKIAFVQVETQERIGITNFMLAITNYLRRNGVPDITLFLLLSIPIIATIITFFRQFVGIATLGIYTPMVFTLTFLIIGGIIGSSTFIVIAGVSIILRQIMNKIRLMYVPKMAMILIGTTLAVIGLFVASAFFNVRAFIEVDIFPLILLLTMGERFISLQLERGMRAASFLFLETIIVALIIYLLLEWQRVNIVAYPEIILLMIPLNFFIGQWTGLRLSELLRFRDLLDTAEQQESEE